MNKNRRILSLLSVISIILTFSIISVSASVTTIDDFTVNINVSKQNLSIDEYNGNGGDIVIPDKLSGYYVDSISSRAFLNCENITSITFPRYLYSIGSYAFSGCTGIDSITINYATNIIEKYAFHNCSSLTTATINGNMTAISDYTFYNCKALSDVVLPSTMRVIYKGAFRDCTSLKNINIPNNVNTIGDYAFYNTGLESIILGKNVTNIGENAFGKCSENLVISGYTGSVAEAYCAENNINFYPLDVKYGDVNNDGKINVKDATFLQKSIIKFEGFEIADGSRAFYAADVNGDNKLDITDCTFIMKYAVRAIDKFPVEQ